MYVQVLGSGHDLHSGVDGGVGNEPLMDLMAVVSGLLEVCVSRKLRYIYCLSGFPAESHDEACENG